MAIPTWRYSGLIAQRMKLSVSDGSMCERLDLQKISRMITYSVFRLAARRTVLCGWLPRLECAPVSEKRVGLNRSPRRQGYGR
jgi:hypothetical protein